MTQLSVYQQHQPSGTNDLYLKLKDGDDVKMRIVSEPVISVYQAGKKPRYSWIIWNRADNKPQVYTAGVSVYSQIADLAEEWGEPTTFDIRVKRKGSGQFDTEYSVIPVKTSEELTKPEQDEVGKVDLIQATKGKWLADYIDDKELPDPVQSGVDEPEPTPTDEDAPINLDDVPF